MSIIPGIEIAAPERTETSSGSSWSPKRLPVFSSSRAHVLGDLVLEPVREVARGHVGAAGVGRDREPARHRQARCASSRRARSPCRRAARDRRPSRLVEVEDERDPASFA